jgi:hypothetical protein
VNPVTRLAAYGASLALVFGMAAAVSSAVVLETVVVSTWMRDGAGEHPSEIGTNADQGHATAPAVESVGDQFS